VSMRMDRSNDPSRFLSEAAVHGPAGKEWP
jgi:hypothetical protein